MYGKRKPKIKLWQRNFPENFQICKSEIKKGVISTNINVLSKRFLNFSIYVTIYSNLSDCIIHSGTAVLIILTPTPETRSKNLSSNPIPANFPKSSVKTFPSIPSPLLLS